MASPAARTTTPAVRLDVATLMERARKAVGLTDFGDDWFTMPLNKLVGFINAEAGLVSEDVWPVRYLVSCLADRLRLVDYLKRHPKVRDEQVNVVGVILSGRGGSTFLQRLLGASPQLTSTRSWETYEPIPLPDEAPGDFSERIAIGRQRHVEHGEIWPEFKAIHPLDPMAYDEELLLMDREFVSQMWPSYFNMRSYNHWETAIDQSKVYDELKLWLQLLQYQDPRRRNQPKWLLKSVQHLISGGLPYLLRTFPDAKAIMTHRDLVDVISSWCSAQAVLLKASKSSTYSHADLGPRIAEMYLEGLQIFLTVRKEFPADRFVDVQYRAMMSDPVGEFRRVMECMGLTVTPEDEAAAKLWLSQNGRDTHPRHHYRPEDYGLTREGLSATFKFYHDAFVR